MSRIIPHICKTKIGRGLFFPLKYSDLEANLFARADKDIHLYAYFQANHSYWLSKSCKLRREERFTLANLTYTPNDRFRYWPGLLPDDSIIVGCMVQALPNELATNVGLTRSILHGSITNAFLGLGTEPLFRRRWQIIARLNLRERLLECASFAWQSTTPVATHYAIELDEDNDAQATLKRNSWERGYRKPTH